MSLRDEMPSTAAFIDAMRDAFGKDTINAEIKKGVAGLPGHFYAEENGREVGTAFPAPGGTVGGEALFINPTQNQKDSDANRNRIR